MPPGALLAWIDAAELGDEEAAQRLDAIRAMPWEQQLRRVAFYGQTDWVQRLLDSRPAQASSPAVGHALLSACSVFSDAELVRLLAARAPDASQQLLGDCLSAAARWGTASMVRALLELERGPAAAEQPQTVSWHREYASRRLDERDYVVMSGVLPLHLAARRRRGPGGALRALLRAAPNAAYAADDAGQLPLHWAARCGFLEGVQQLLQAAPDAVEVPDARGRYPLHLAALQGSEAAVQLLLHARPSLAAARDASGRQPLHYAACSGGSSAVVRLLLEAAPAGGPDDAGQWPLHHAASRGNGKPAVVQLLLEAAPAAATQRDASGRLPLECALERANACWGDAFDLSLGDPPETKRGWAANAIQHIHAARLLLPTSGSSEGDAAVAALAKAGSLAAPLWVDAVARWRLTAQQWRQVPAPCPGLAAALPAVLRRSEAEAGCLVGRLPEADRARLRTFALALARLARTMDPPLPAPTVRLALSMFGLP